MIGWWLGVSERRTVRDPSERSSKGAAQTTGREVTRARRCHAPRHSAGPRCAACSSTGASPALLDPWRPAASPDQPPPPPPPPPPLPAPLPCARAPLRDCLRPGGPAPHARSRSHRPPRAAPYAAAAAPFVVRGRLRGRPRPRARRRRPRRRANRPRKTRRQAGTRRVSPCRCRCGRAAPRAR
eukprot:scaffold28204_cov65-Phaeocystis_antarctica.AAC.10